MRRAVFLAPLFLAGCAAVETPPPPLPKPAPGPTPAVQPQPADGPPDLVLVDKSERKLWLLRGGTVQREFTGLQFGDAPEGHKQFEGDEKTPEGRYTIDYRNPRSAYHLSLHISYPNADDTAYARARVRSPGGAIFIHGQPNQLVSGRVAGDWTDGCIALSDSEIEQLWALVPDGTPIEIRP